MVRGRLALRPLDALPATVLTSRDIDDLTPDALASSAGEVWVMLPGPLLGMPLPRLPLPRLPLQVPWVNLVTDGLPVLAVAVRSERLSLFTQGWRASAELLRCVIGGSIVFWAIEAQRVRRRRRSQGYPGGAIDADVDQAVGADSSAATPDRNVV